MPCVSKGKGKVSNSSTTSPQGLNFCEHYNYKSLELAAKNFKDPPIGTGAFGTVYKAHIPNKGDAAIKKITLEGSDSGANQLFLKEIAMISNVRHKNILPVWGYSFPQNGSPVLMVTPLHSSLHKRLFEPESGQWLEGTIKNINRCGRRSCIPS